MMNNEKNNYALSGDAAKNVVSITVPDRDPDIFPDNVTFKDPETQDLYSAEFVGLSLGPHVSSITYRLSRCISFDKYESAIAVIHSDDQLALLNSNVKEFWDRYVGTEINKKG